MIDSTPILTPLTSQHIAAAASRGRVGLSFGQRIRRAVKAPVRRSKGSFSDRLSDYATELRLSREKQEKKLRNQRRKQHAANFAAKHPVVKIPA